VLTSSLTGHLKFNKRLPNIFNVLGPAPVAG